MQKNNMFNFDYSYLKLPNKFYSITNSNTFPKPEKVIINKNLCNTLNLPINSNKDLFNFLFDKKKTNKSFSQAYAGHQFGHFTKLGDGRAIILGEYIIENKQRFDIQLKGSGRTPYSRGGDGKATLKAMLREYLISEAMYHLNIPSSRSLTVIKTGEQIHRQSVNEGAILARLMKSHIRVGTFEYAYFYCEKNSLNKLTSYTINRLYPEINQHENPPLSLLEKVMKNQIDLVVDWMRVGFIHGVMNTDNTSISGETFDYGPCAFMNSFNPETTYSSIDYNKRYSFGNQPKIIKWNISRFAESLIPIIHKNKEKSIQLAQSVIDKFERQWEKKYYGMMLKKIGINQNDKSIYPLVDELLNFMQKFNKDYNNTFWYLSQEKLSSNKLVNNLEFKRWNEKWKKCLYKFSKPKESKYLMSKNNPVVIPRNHLVEKALEDANNGNINTFKKLLNIISKPYHNRKNLDKFMIPPDSSFEQDFKTYCGT
ncbi:MAG: YdiU family protein [Bacteroidota bacterium]|nr:YdiU family protein [Bacteroidota bacterium]